MKAFCTIISPDFLPFAQCLFTSLRRYDSTVHLHVLVTDETNKPTARDGFSFYTLNEIDSDYIKQLTDQYQGINDNLRWSLKPVFLLHLLQSFEKVIYIDSDIHFFSNYDFLYDTLELHSFLLTPHYACIDPFEKEGKFMMNFLYGLFNAGFVGVNRKANSSLKWWLKACLYNTADDPAHGFFVDQRYLDLIPIIDREALILKHQGCNIGSWNIETYRRVIQHDNSVLINNHYPVVFIHFNHETISHILNGDDNALKPYYDQYNKTFSSGGHQLSEYITKLDFWKKTGMFQQIKRKFSIRTRIKKTFFNLAKKL